MKSRKTLVIEKLDSCAARFEWISDVKEVRLKEELSERNKTFEVICNTDTYLIRQYGKEILCDGLDVESRAKKEIELYRLLNANTKYVCKIEKININLPDPKITGSDNVVFETMMKCTGIDLMRYRKTVDVSPHNLIRIFCQSALAIGNAHRLGIYHGDLIPKNMIVHNSSLKLIGFDVFSQTKSKRLAINYKARCDLKGCEFYESYCPPEVLHYKQTEGIFSVSAEKIDVYTWGMSMLQFFLKIQDKELNRFTGALRTTPEECAIKLKEIKSLRIEGLEEDISHFIMRLICKCLQYSPNSRTSIHNIICCLVNSQRNFKAINKLLNKNLIFELFGFIRKPAYSTPKMCLKTAATVFHQIIDPVLQPSINELSKHASKEDIASDSILEKIEFVVCISPKSESIILQYYVYIYIIYIKLRIYWGEFAIHEIIIQNRQGNKTNETQ